MNYLLKLVVLVYLINVVHSAKYEELDKCMRELEPEYEKLVIPEEVKRATELVRELKPGIVMVTKEQDLKVKVHLRYHLNPTQFDSLTRQCLKLLTEVRMATLKHSCVFDHDLPAYYEYLKHLYPKVHEINEYAYLSTALAGY